MVDPVSMKVAMSTQPYTILRGIVGSTIHGLHLGDQDDRDEMAVAIEPPEFVIGLARAKFERDGKWQQGFEHIVERTQPEGARSGPGDLDRTTYSLRKWMRLACQGNPTTLVMLFIPETYCDVLTELGRQLQENSDWIVSKASGPRFMGYMHSQKLRLIGEQGQKRVKRPELEEAHGFDTKYAAHVLRLAIQGMELMQTGRLTLPMPTTERLFLRAVREGNLSKETVLTAIDDYEQQLGHAVARSRLPDQPQWQRINDFMLRAYRETWGW